MRVQALVRIIGSLVRDLAYSLCVGAWIEQVSKLLHPGSVIHGVDLNAAILPHDRSLNTSFSVASITALPSTWANRFDIVNHRYLLWALSPDEWLQSLQNAFRVLVPGGWIQVIEPSIATAAGTTTRLNEVIARVLDSRNIRADADYFLPELFKKVGFVDVQKQGSTIKVGKWGGQIGMQAGDVLMDPLKSMKPLVIKLGCGFEHPETDFDEFLLAARREWDGSVGASMDINVFFAQKPIVKLAT
jgi:hypothetical protein